MEGILFKRMKMRMKREEKEFRREHRGGSP
jgi:hypothetical protein